MDREDPYTSLFWDVIQTGLGGSIRIPDYLKFILKIHGYDNSLSISGLTMNHVREFENYMKSPCYARLVPANPNKMQYYGLHSNDPESFEFSLGDRRIFVKIIDFVKQLTLDDWEQFFKDKCSTPENHNDTTDTTAPMHVDPDDDLPAGSFLKLLNVTYRKNKDKKPTGHRYPHELKLICAFLRMVSGPIAYETIASLLKDSVPALSTINKFIHEYSETIVEGEVMVKQLKKFLDERNLPREVVLSEDATRVVSKIEYDSKTDQGVGCVLPYDGNSMPVPGSYPTTTVLHIQNTFDHAPRSTMIYTYMIQPLAKDAPSCCLVLFGTDGKFTTPDCYRRLNYLTQVLEAEGIKVKGYSSDGDPKLLKTHQILSGLGSEASFSFTINGVTVLFPEFHANYSTKICIQDVVHVGGKMKNRLLRDSTIIPLGRYTACVADLLYLINSDTRDKHGLTFTDIDQRDKMNFRPVVKISEEKVILSLKKHVADSDATQIYLTCINFFLQSFLSKNMSVEERLYKCWFALYFVRIWRAWLEDHEYYNVDDNFLTDNAYKCMELNAHGLLQMVLECLEIGSFEKFLPWLYSSQTCESFYRILRSICTAFSMVVNCTVLEALHKLGRIRLLQDILSYDFEKDGLSVKFPRNKFLHASFETHHFQSESNSDTADEAITLTRVREILDQAKADALNTAEKLGMPRPPADADECFVDFLDPAEIDRSNRNRRDGDENSRLGETIPESEHSSYQEGEAFDEASGTMDLEDEVEEIQADLAYISSINNLQLTDYSTNDGSFHVPENLQKKIHEFLIIPEPSGASKLVRKRAIFWFYSEGERKLSSDRVQRVRDDEVFRGNRVPRSQAASIPAMQVAKQIEFGDWCVFYKNDADGTQSSECLIGRVTGFTYMGNGPYKERQYSNRFVRVKGNRKEIGVMCTWYSVDADRTLQYVALENAGYHPLERYNCTIRKPKFTEETLYLDEDVAAKIGNSCRV